MSSFSQRSFEGPSDLQAMIDLLVAVRPAGRLSDYPGIADLQEALARPAIQAQARLWEDDGGQLVGFACVDADHKLLFEIAHEVRGSGIVAEMVAWGEACVRRDREAGDEDLTLDAGCRAEDGARIALLERHGFVRLDQRTLRLARPLDQPLPAAEPPPGFTIRAVAGEAEVEALVALHRAAFGSKGMTVEERLVTMRSPNYDPGLDLMAVDPGGRPVAYCICLVYPEENARLGRSEGHLEVVATHPEFQGRGLARTLVLANLERMRQRGVEVAVLGTSSRNVAMLQLAETTGFRVRSTRLWFGKPVVPDASTGAASYY